MHSVEYLDKIAFTTTQSVDVENYWLKKLSGELTKTNFPYDFPKKTIDERRMERLDFKLSGELYERLMRLANYSFSRLHMVLIAGMTALLNKYTGSKDILVGTPIYKQEIDAEFINTVLVLRNRLTDDITFKELILNVRETIVEADENQNFPIELLIQRLKIPYALDDDFPLFDIVILLENIQEKSYISHVNFNLLFSFLETGQNLEADVEYNGLAYKRATVERIINHFFRLLQVFLLELGMDLCIFSVGILSEEEKQQLLVDFNNTQAEYPRDKTIHELIESRVEVSPHQTALAEVYCNSFITYKELNEKAHRAANRLREKGINLGSIVVLQAGSSIEMIIGILAILKAGAVYLPVDPDTPAARIKFLLKDSSVGILLSGGSEVSEVSGGTEVIHLPLLIVETKDLESTHHTHPTHSTQLCYIIYTSGTTGTPRGVMVEHRGLVNYIWWAAAQYVKNEPADFPLYTSISFDLTVTSLFTPLITGNKVIIYRNEKENRAGSIEKIIDDNRVEVVKATPSHLKLIRDKKISGNGICRIKRFIIGGEELDSRLADDIYKSFGGDIEIYNEYGPTETVVGSMIYRYDSNICDRNSVPIGVPINNTRVHLLDGCGNPVCVGVDGEIHISGVGVARGYLNHPELTEEKFLKNSFVEGERMYRSGDLGRWIAGKEMNIEFSGRRDKQVKIRGFRVELMEVERQLAGHPLVKDSVVAVRGDDGSAGNDNKRLVAYIVPHKEDETAPGGPSDISKLELGALVKEYLMDYLPFYMVPSYILPLEEIPLTANGKVEWRALPEPQASLENVEYTAPRNEIEQRLAEMWSEILTIVKEKISIDANFFDLGGHSLLATRLVSLIHREFNVKVPIVEIFKTPRIRDLSLYLDNANKDKYIAIKAVEKKEYYTQSSSQRRLYVLQELERQSIAYNVPQVTVLDGEYKKEKLLETVGKLIRRHEVLRTSFTVINAEPVQRVHDVDEVTFDIEYCCVEKEVALPTKKGEESKEYKEADVIRDFIRSFDLSQQPLLRVGLIKTGETKHILIVDMHHIISDGVSNNILIEEFKQLHAGMQLSPLRIQYKDYSEWQIRLMASGAMGRQRTFWLREFQGEIPVLHLPTDYTRPALQSFAGDHVLFSIPGEESEGLKRLARDHDATVFMVLLSVLNVLLAKLGSQEDIVVGTPIAGRRHADLDHVVGMLVNTLAIRTFPMAWKRFNNFLMEVKDKALEVFENQEYPFDDLVEEAEVRRDLSRNPLFDMMFAMDSDVGTAGEWGLEMRPAVDEGNADLLKDVFRVVKFDLYMTAVESVGPMVFSLEYCTRLFTRGTIERFIGYFKRVITAVVERPGREIREIEIIDETEKEQLLYGFNDTQVEYQRNKTIHELFAEQAERTPDSVSLVGIWHLAVGKGEKTGETVQLTYKELSEKSNRLARLLKEKGVKTGSIVGLMVKRSLEMMIGIWGIMKVGGAYLPIDTKFPGERVQYMLADCKAKILLAAPSAQVKVKVKVKVKEDSTGPIEMIDISRELSSSTLTLSQVSPANLAYVIYTSGSTGKPKGVMLEHRAVVNFIKGITDIMPFKEDDRILSLTTVSFDIFALETLLPLTVGSTVVIGSEEEQLDVEAAASTMQDEHITIFQVTPSHLQILMSNDEARKRLKNLKYLLVGGEEFPESLLEKARAVTEGKIFNMYGPTETTIWSTVKDLTDKAPLNIGTPIANTQIYILSPGGSLQPVGIHGELCIGGDGLARGYVNRPELTAERFVDYRSYMSSRTYSSKKIYKTGDLARWLPDGNIEFSGRIDHQLKVRGFRIEPGEIEVRLLKHEDINETVVIGREDEAGEKYLCAYIVLRGKREEGAKLEVSELRSMLSTVLPDYMIPSYFVPVEYIPLSPSGKIDRKALPEPQLTIGSEYAYIVPISETEKKLVKIWAEMLKLDEQVIGCQANFFELGGHSVRALNLIAKIHKELKVKVPIREFFTNSTVRKLSEYIEKSVKDDFISIKAVEKRDYYVLSSAQKRMYILQQMEPEKTTYNIQIIKALDRSFEKDQFENALKKLIARHESLRTSFELVHEVPVQRVAAADMLDFSVDYFNGIKGLNEPPENDNHEVRRIIDQFVKPFDLSLAPLFRVGLIQIDAKKNILLLDLHHIIADGISIEIMLKDILWLCFAQEMPELRLQYKDYAVWQNGEEQQRLIKKQGEYWLDVFSGDLAVLDLPGDYERPTVRRFEGKLLQFEMDEKETESLRQIGASQHATLYMVLLAVVNILLSKLSNQQDIVVGTYTFGRSHADLQQILGMFINTLAMRNKPLLQTSFNDFLVEVKNNTLEAFENQDYQFEDLVEQVVGERSLNRNPLFDVFVGLQNRAEYASTEAATVSKSDGQGTMETGAAKEADNLKRFEYELGTSHFDVALWGIEVGEKILFNLEYDTQLFKSNTIARMIEDFRQIVRSVIADPHIKIKNIRLESLLRLLKKVDLAVEFNI